MCSQSNSNQTAYDFENGPKIRDIYIEAPNFEKYHFPKGESLSDADNNLIGRQELKAELVSFIEKSLKKEKGTAILVAGFRGVGKTALVESVIDKVDSIVKLEKPRYKKKKVVNVKISVSQEGITYKDLLRSMVFSLRLELEKGSGRYCLPKSHWFEWRIWPILSLLVVTFILILNFISLLGFISPMSFFSYDQVPTWLEATLFIFTPALFMFHFLPRVFRRKRVIRTLKQLEERLSSEILMESAESIGVGGHESLGFYKGKSSRKQKKYPVSNGKDIELEFKEVLQSEGLGNRHVIFTLDELDKLDSDYLVDPDFDPSGSYEEIAGSSYMSESIRKRQYAVAKIIANLKSLLNEANATFICIAGREMYDACLADVAARDSFYGSIFHKIVYVPSLLITNDDKPPYGGVSKSVEQFVLRLFLGRECGQTQKPIRESNSNPSSEEKGSKLFSLKEFYEKMGGLESEDADDLERPRKALYSIQNFIIYLVYRSNGMPKKVMQLIESNMVKISSEQNINGSSSLILPRASDKSSYYLKLDHTLQHEIGFINYLYRPYLVSYGRASKFRSDKLLVSTSFMVDHLLKFNNMGFSWRNLELTPEILSIGKEPGLRQHVKGLMETLFNTHLRSINNGIHQYKFHARLEHEVRFLSRISPLNSAAFNFTLDESLLIKKQYNKRLQRIRQNHVNSSNTAFIKSIGFMNSMLGDLHFFDQDYGDAIVNYKDAIQNLESKRLSEISFSDFTFWVRMMLKVGFSYERMKAFGSALSVYSEIQANVIEYSQLLTSPKNEKSSAHPNAWKQTQRELKIFSEPFLAHFALIEKSSLDGVISSNAHQNLLAFCKWLKNVTSASTENEGDQELTIDYKSPILLKANYVEKRGGILFLKNGNIFWEDEGQYIYRKLKLDMDCPTSVGQDYRPPISALIDYWEALSGYLLVLNELNLCEKSKKTKKGFDRSSKSVVSFNLITKFLQEGNRHIQFSGVGSEFVATLARLISKIGDCLLCFKDNSDINLSKFKKTLDRWSEKPKMKTWMNKLSSEITNTFGTSSELLEFDTKTVRSFPVVQIFSLFELSALLYTKSGKYINASFQRRKIFYGLNLLDFDPKENVEGILNSLNHYLFSKIIQSNHDAHGNIVRQQTLKYEFVIDEKNVYKTNLDISSSIYNHTPTSLESKEVLLLFTTFLLKYKRLQESAVCTDNPAYKLYRSKSFASAGSVYLRYWELITQMRVLQDDLSIGKNDKDRRLIRKEILKLKTTEFTSLRSSQRTVFEIICDGIYCGQTILNMLKIHGVTSVFSHSVLADCQLRLAVFCHLLKISLEDVQKCNDNLDNSKGKREKLKMEDYERVLNELLGSGIKHRLDPKQYLESALENYRLSISSHNGGRAYRILVEEMFYLDDDFSDNFVHFGVTLERFLVNSGKIQNKIQEIEELLGKDNTTGAIENDKNDHNQSYDGSMKFSRYHNYKSYLG